MQKRLLLFVLLSIQSCLYAQNSLDSLYLQSVNSQGKEKIQSLVTLAEIYKDENLDSCISVLKKAYDLSTQTDEDEYLPDIYQLMGVYYSQVGNHIFALKFSNYALTKKKELEYPIEEIAEIQNNIGSIYLKQNNFKEAINYYNLALNNWKTVESSRTGSAYVNLGTAFYSMGESDQALEYYQKGEQFFNEINDQRELANIYNHLGRLHQNNGTYDKAKIYFERALNSFLDLEYYSGIADGYNNLAILYYYQEKVQLALAYFKKALSIRKEEGEVLSISESYYNLGSLYQFEGMNKEAVLHFKKALEYAQQGNSPSDIEDASFAVSENFKSLNQYDSAYKYLSVCINYKDTVASKKYNYLKNELKYNDAKTESKLIALKEKSENKLATVTKTFSTQVDTQEKQLTLFYFLTALLVALLFLFIFLYFKQKKVSSPTFYPQKDIDATFTDDTAIPRQLSTETIKFSNTTFLKQQSFFDRIQLNTFLQKSNINFYAQNGVHFFTLPAEHPLQLLAQGWIYTRLKEQDFDLKMLPAMEKELTAKFDIRNQLQYFSIEKKGGEYLLTGKFTTVLLIKENKIVRRIDFNFSVTEKAPANFDHLVVATYQKKDRAAEELIPTLNLTLQEGDQINETPTQQNFIYFDGELKMHDEKSNIPFFIAKRKD